MYWVSVMTATLSIIRVDVFSVLGAGLLSDSVPRSDAVLCEMRKARHVSQTDHSERRSFDKIEG